MLFINYVELECTCRKTSGNILQWSEKLFLKKKRSRKGMLKKVVREWIILDKLSNFLD